MTPKGIIFWRHMVAISVIALAQNPRFYNSGEMFFGLWAGRLTVIFLASATIMGAAFLFATTFAKKRIWGIYIISCWIALGFNLFGQWVLPGMVEKISEKSIEVERKIRSSKQVPVSDNNTESRDSFDFNYIGARQAGLTDEEIINHLRTLNVSDYDFDGALKAGCSPKDIVDYLVQRQKLQSASKH